MTDKITKKLTDKQKEQVGIFIPPVLSQELKDICLPGVLNFGVING